MASLADTPASYDVVLRDLTTGEERLYHVAMPWSIGDKWWWTQGNMNCDCNRGLDFARAGSPDKVLQPGDVEAPCGHARYLAVRAVLPDGEEIELDGPEGYHARLEELKRTHPVTCARCGEPVDRTPYYPKGSPCACRGE